VEAEHFEMSVPEDTSIGGLTLLPPITDGKRLISLDLIDRKHVAGEPLSTSDIVDPSAPPKAPIQRQQSSARTWFFIVFNVFCLVVIVIYLGWKRRTLHEPSSR
jgi:hypothetical protein